MSETETRKFAIIQTPPRRSGNAETDAANMVDWLWTFYQATVNESGLLDPTFQASAGRIDPDNLPDPANTSIARAQATANDAYRTAIDAAGGKNRLYQSGTFTIQGATDSGSVVFDQQTADTNFTVIVTVSDSSGGPTVTSLQVVRVTKSTGGFAVLLFAAPGAGKSITFDYAVFLRG